MKNEIIDISNKSMESDPIDFLTPLIFFDPIDFFIVVPNAGNSAQQSVLNQAVIYGESRGVTLNIIKYP